MSTLRRAVREMLSRHSLVRSHASPPPRQGGHAVTLLQLATLAAVRLYPVEAAALTVY